MNCAKDIMTTDVGTVTELALVSITAVLSESLHVRHIPVLDQENKPVGMISLRELFKSQQEARTDEFLPAREVMSTEVISAKPEASLVELAELMLKHNVSSIVIVENERMVGIVTERDFLKTFV